MPSAFSARERAWRSSDSSRAAPAPRDCSAADACCRSRSTAAWLSDSSSFACCAAMRCILASCSAEPTRRCSSLACSSRSCLIRSSCLERWSAASWREAFSSRSRRRASDSNLEIRSRIRGAVCRSVSLVAVACIALRRMYCVPDIVSNLPAAAPVEALPALPPARGRDPVWERGVRRSAPSSRCSR